MSPRNSQPPGDVLNRHQPDFVFYLAGADPYECDRLGRLKMTIDWLRELLVL